MSENIREQADGWKRDNHSLDVDHTRWPSTSPPGMVVEVLRCTAVPPDGD